MTHFNFILIHWHMNCGPPASLREGWSLSCVPTLAPVPELPVDTFIPLLQMNKGRSPALAWPGPSLHSCLTALALSGWFCQMSPYAEE